MLVRTFPNIHVNRLFRLLHSRTLNSVRFVHLAMPLKFLSTNI